MSCGEKITFWSENIKKFFFPLITHTCELLNPNKNIYVFFLAKQLIMFHNKGLQDILNNCTCILCDWNLALALL